MTNKLKILIIDDNPDDLEFYSDLLAQGKTDYEVLTAESAEQGIEIFNDNKIDCTFIDYNMPDANGMEVLSILKGKSVRKDIAIIILTGEPHQKVQAEAAREGALDYIVKDSHNSPEQLEEVINKVVKWVKG